MPPMAAALAQVASNSTSFFTENICLSPLAGLSLSNFGWIASGDTSTPNWPQCAATDTRMQTRKQTQNTASNKMPALVNNCSMASEKSRVTSSTLVLNKLNKASRHNGWVVKAT